MFSYILLLLGVFILSKQVHMSFNWFSLEDPDDEQKTKQMHARANKWFLVSLALLLGVSFWGWTLKGSMFLLWSGLIFAIEFFVERRAFNWRNFYIKGEWDTGLAVFLNLARVAIVISFFVWF